MLTLCASLDFVFLQQDIESNKRAVFPEHLPLSEIQKGLKSGKYLQGSFQTSRENYMEASVGVHDKEDRVRALWKSQNGENYVWIIVGHWPWYTLELFT